MRTLTVSPHTIEYVHVEYMELFSMLTIQDQLPLKFHPRFHPPLWLGLPLPRGFFDLVPHEAQL